MNPGRPWTDRRRADSVGKSDGPVAGLSSLGSTRFDHREPSTLIGVAPHWSHRVRERIAPKLAIDDTERAWDARVWAQPLDRYERERGEAILDWIRERLAAFTLGGTTCSFGENTVFHGGYLSRRLSRTYGPPRCRR